MCHKGVVEDRKGWFPNFTLRYGSALFLLNDGGMLRSRMQRQCNCSDIILWRIIAICTTREQKSDDFTQYSCTLLLTFSYLYPQPCAVVPHKIMERSNTALCDSYERDHPPVSQSWFWRDCQPVGALVFFFFLSTVEYSHRSNFQTFIWIVHIHKWLGEFVGLNWLNTPTVPSSVYIFTVLKQNTRWLLFDSIFFYYQSRWLYWLLLLPIYNNWLDKSCRVHG